jgi:Ubiquitin family
MLNLRKGTIQVIKMAKIPAMATSRLVSSLRWLTVCRTNTAVEVVTLNSKGKLQKMKVNVHPDDTVKQVKAKIEDQRGIPREQQILYFGGNELDDDSLVSDYEIKKGSKIRLHLDLPSSKHRRNSEPGLGSGADFHYRRDNAPNTVANVAAITQAQNTPQNLAQLFYGVPAKNNKRGLPLERREAIAYATEFAKRDPEAFNQLYEHAMMESRSLPGQDLYERDLQKRELIKAQLAELDRRALALESLEAREAEPEVVEQLGLDILPREAEAEALAEPEPEPEPKKKDEKDEDEEESKKGKKQKKDKKGKKGKKDKAEKDYGNISEETKNWIQKIPLLEWTIKLFANKKASPVSA